jgi:glycosyltransferase involved in cell wall biosynthesis
VTESSRQLRFLSVVPSPYQRDLFLAIERLAGKPPGVFYLEHAAPDSPWPAAILNSWETVLPGFTLGRQRWRSHVNWKLPPTGVNGIWVVNGAMTDVTTQIMMRRLGQGNPWVFWGETPSPAKRAAKRWLQRWEYAPLKKARAIVAVGKRAQDAYRALAPDVPIFNQPYSCQIDAFETARRARVARREPVFLFCGQMIARKGIDVLLNAFAALVENGYPGRLLLIGREAQLPPLLDKLSTEIRARIEYAGFQPPAALPQWFVQADVFVLPSRHDGWGVVVNQAMASALPVISSDAAGAGLDLVQHEQNGLLVPAGDTRALFGAMNRLAASPELRAAWGMAASQTARRLQPDVAARFWLELAQRYAPG